MKIPPTPPGRSAGIPAPPLHARPRPSRVSQTPRCCQRGRQGTRAACVMGAGNKDAQDPVPWLPRTNRPDLPGLLPRASKSGSPHFPGLPGAIRTGMRSPMLRATRVGRAPTPLEEENHCFGLGEKRFPSGNSACITPAPTHAQPQARELNTSPAGHPSPPRASQRHKRTC